MIGSDSASVFDLVANIVSEFKIRDMGSPSFFLGIETIQDRGGLLLSQQRYMKDILKRAGVVDCKPLTAPVTLTRSGDSPKVPNADSMQYHSLASAL